MTIHACSPVRESPPRWLLNATSPGKALTIKSASQTISSLFDWLEEHGLEALDFSPMAAGECNPEHAVACLRTVFLSRHIVPGWHLALRAAYDAFALRGTSLDETTSILMGLLPSPDA
jgi:hypothetical protein